MSGEAVVQKRGRENIEALAAGQMQGPVDAAGAEPDVIVDQPDKLRLPALLMQPPAERLVDVALALGDRGKHLRLDPRDDAAATRLGAGVVEQQQLELRGSIEMEILQRFAMAVP